MNEAFKLAPHEWAQLRALLDEAMTQPPADRLAWVDRLDDARHGPLKPRLHKLLAHSPDAVASAPDTLERLLDTLPKVETDHFALRPGSGEKVGDAVGPYKLVRELGSGGMGSVWLAEHTDLLQGRQVALKLPHGAWKRAGLAERLARERAILATLEHPNIARLYDAGVMPEGQPWLALEYVAGERIDVHCENKALPVKARLALFLQVARAVAHAHAQLVVHRDLKPANILVADSGGVSEVKLLDFGIAKLVAEGVAEETELTREVGRAFTPEYASPEQILGRPLGTASDVYSLGVVLFELLADVRPYKLARSSRAALEEAVATADVPRPSTLAPAERRLAIRGDLDTIVLKALKREPAERYATVAALADDIQRHIEQRPVLAQPDSAVYRLRMFVRRNRLVVAAGSAVMFGVLGGAAVALWQATLARAEQERADQVKTFIASILAEASPYESGAGVPTVMELLRQAETKLAVQVGTAPATRVELLNTLAQSFIGLYQLDDAERLASQALAEARRHLPSHARESLVAQRLWTSVLRNRGRTGEVVVLLDTLIPELERAGPALRSELFEALNTRVHVLIDLGRAPDALASAESALALAQTLHGEASPSAATSAASLATAMRFARRTDEAVAASERAVRLTDAAFASQPKHPIPAQARIGLASALADVGEPLRGASEMRAAITMVEQRQGADHPELGYHYGNLALIQLDSGDPQGARESMARSFSLLAAQVDRASTTYGVMLHRRASVQLALRRGEQGIDDLAHAVAVLTKSLGPNHDRVADARAAHVRSLANAGRSVEARQQLASLSARAASAPHGVRMRTLEAAASVDLAVGQPDESAAALAALGAPAAESRRQFGSAARAATSLAQVHLEHGRPDAAGELLAKARRWFGEYGVADSPDTMDMRLGLGRVALARREVAAALPDLRAADAYWARMDTTNPAAGEAAYWLARALEMQADLAGARAAFARAVPGLTASKQAAAAARLREAREAMSRLR